MGLRPTDLLREEHTAVLQKLDALESIILHTDGKADTAAELRPLASFFQTDFWVHFAKEEEGLFPEMEKFIPRDMCPIGVMLAEHEDLRRTNAELQKAFEIYLADPGDARAGASMSKLGAHFIGVLRDHIDKENGILFMMAEMHLDRTQMEKVLAVFHQVAARESTANPA